MIQRYQAQISIQYIDYLNRNISTCTGCTIVSRRFHSSLFYLIGLLSSRTLLLEHNTISTIAPQNITNQKNAGNPYHQIDHGEFSGTVFHSPNFILTTARGFQSFIIEPFHHHLISSHSQQEF